MYDTIEKCEDRVVAIHGELAEVRQLAQVKQHRLNRQWMNILKKHRLEKQFEAITKQKQAILDKSKAQLEELVAENEKLVARIRELSGGDEPPPEPEAAVGTAAPEAVDLEDENEPLWSKIQRATEAAEEAGLDPDRVNSMVIGGMHIEEAIEKLEAERVVPLQQDG